MEGAFDRINEEVTAWAGVEAGTGKRGEWSFKLGPREVGHLHGDHAAHFMFPAAVGAELKAAGRVVDHPVFPGKPGPAARRIDTGEDVADVIALLRENYDRIVDAHGVPEAA
jgi:hypothetical protein